LESKKHRRDIGHEFLSRFFRRRPQHTAVDDETAPLLNSKPQPPPSATKPPPLRKILTPNILTTLLAFGLLPLHNSTFMHLYTIFLSTPRGGSALHGGLELPAQRVGLALSLLGVIGILVQLFFYPPLQQHFGLLRSFQLSCYLFPIAYMFTPLLSFLAPTAWPCGWGL
jgi:hypothetical protein